MICADFSTNVFSGVFFDFCVKEMKRIHSVAKNPEIKLDF